MQGLLMLLPLPLKATQSHQVLHEYLQWVTCLHSLNPIQVLLLTSPGNASADAYKRHIDSQHDPATDLTMDDRVWLSSECILTIADQIAAVTCSMRP